DCRILMLKEARTYMEMISADFLITGEVLGQRPLSQVRPMLDLVMKEAGVKDILLRPLSAKRLPPTKPEREGLVDREQLEGITGRGRKRQLELAEEFGLEDYPTPAGGCLLTDKGYSNRLRDLLAHTERLTFDDLNLLRVGRHFRVNPETKVIVGRDEADNNLIDAYRREHHIRLEAMDIGSPVTLLVGPNTEENIRMAAMLTARYSSARNQPQVVVTVEENNQAVEISVTPATEADTKSLVIR
ncbi:MAG: tRNA 4-thiouridine(8) synthase ThiI, partial [Candidatus Zixiibacteriota bacterium]